MQNSYESLIENRLYAGAPGEEAPRPLDQVTRPADAGHPIQGLLDSLQQAQSAFSKSLERYIEL